MTSLSQNPNLDPKEVAARLLITPSALEELTFEDATLVVNHMQPRRIDRGNGLARRHATICHLHGGWWSPPFRTLRQERNLVMNKHTPQTAWE